MMDNSESKSYNITRWAGALRWVLSLSIGFWMAFASLDYLLRNSGNEFLLNVSTALTLAFYLLLLVSVCVIMRLLFSKEGRMVLVRPSTIGLILLIIVLLLVLPWIESEITWQSYRRGI